MKIITNDIAVSSEQIADQVKDLLAEKPDAVLGVSFGRDLIPVYQKLKELGQAGELPFGNVRVFVCCEYRDLDKEHEGSVHSYMKNNLFDGAGFNESNIFYPCLCSEDEDELKKYDDQISAAGGIDLMILGIGINGSIPCYFTQHVIIHEGIEIMIGICFIEYAIDVGRYQFIELRKCAGGIVRNIRDIQCTPFQRVIPETILFSGFLIPSFDQIIFFFQCLHRPDIPRSAGADVDPDVIRQLDIGGGRESIGIVCKLCDIAR